MNNHCICESKPSDLCCPGDEKLRKAWLIALENEYESIKKNSEEITVKFKLLSHPDRVKILLMLEQREHCVCEITKKLNVPKSALSYHLGLLKKYGIVCAKKRSRFSFYTLSHTGKNMLALFQR